MQLLIELPVRLIAGGWPISFPLMEKKQKIKASQVLAKSFKNSNLQFKPWEWKFYQFVSATLLRIAFCSDLFIDSTGSF